MKSIFSFFVILLLVQHTSRCQSINTEVIQNGQLILLGKIDKSDLENGNYNWFPKNYTNYKVDYKKLELISQNLGDYNLKLFMGTWCGDSKREVPKIYKLLDALKFPMNKIETVAVGRSGNLYKQSPQHEEKGLNIHRVPTLIFFKNGKEVNRIVERPVESLEADILTIITNKGYESNYSIVSKIDNILSEKGIEGLRKQQNKLIKNYKDKVSSMYELNTYGRILNGDDRTEEAIAVLKLNTELFPEEPKTYLNLANTLNANGYKEKAVKVLVNALKKSPESKDIEKTMKAIKSN